MAKKTGVKKTRVSFSKQLEAISEISKTITSNLYLEEILKLVVTVTASVMNSKICSLFLLDRQTNMLMIKATQSMSEEYLKKVPLKLGEGVVGRVALENKPRVIADVTKEPTYRYRDIAVKERICSLLSVPMAVKGKVIGVLNTYTSKPHTFTQDEINLLIAVANQAAIVIENAELMVKSKVIQEELESRKIIERAKGLLMREQHLTEEEAFKKIQRQSMDMRRSMREIAEAILLMEKMKSA